MAKAKAARKGAKKSTRKTAQKKTAKKARKAKRGPAAKPKKKAASGLLTLTEVSKRTGISMPTLQRYKKEYQDRIPSVGEGRKQRYKPKSLSVFKSIKKENLKKRGRPRKSPEEKAAARAKARRRAAAVPAGLISLSEIGRRTGISYPTLLRYVRIHGRRIPSKGTGRKRRYPEAAVPIFQQLRKESRRGRRKGVVGRKRVAAGTRALSARVRSLERQQAKLSRQVAALVKALKRPVKLSVRGL